LRPLGKPDEALRLLRVALENDPLSLDVQREIGEVQIQAGRYEEAIHTFQRVRAVEPDFPFADSHLARALMFAGRPAEALPVYDKMASRQVGRFLARPPRLAIAYAMLGRRAEAEQVAAQHQDGPPSVLAEIYVAFGDKDRAFEALERTAVVEPQRLPLIVTYPEMAALRGDPRLAALRHRFGLPSQ
jgi:serine/threonine-protein kinase